MSDRGKPDRQKKPIKYRRTWEINPKTRVTPDKKVDLGQECNKCRVYLVDPTACETCQYGEANLDEE